MVAIERLSGGLTPVDGSDPRTFPAIFNGAADDIEQAEADISALDGRVGVNEGDISALDGRVTAVEDGKAPLLLTENVQSSDYTLALSDSSKVVAVVGATGPVTITVPDDVAVPFPVGTVVNVYRGTSETVTVTGDGGVTVRNAGDIGGEFDEVSLRKRDTDEWVLVGQVD